MATNRFESLRALFAFGKTALLRQSVLAVFGFTLLFPTVAIAHPYFPFSPGDVFVYRYQFHIDTTKEEFKAANSAGKMTVVVGEPEDLNGRSYFPLTTTYVGVPGSPEPTKIWLREEKGALKMGANHQGKFYETTILPAVTTVGTEWSYFDGEESTRKITAIKSFEALGKTHTDCLEVTRAPLSNDKLKESINRDFYCRDVGEVKFLFQSPSPIGDYVTETQLEEKRKADK